MELSITQFLKSETIECANTDNSFRHVIFSVFIPAFLENLSNFSLFRFVQKLCKSLGIEVGMAERCKCSRFIYYRILAHTLGNAFCSNLWWDLQEALYFRFFKYTSVTYLFIRQRGKEGDHPFFFPTALICSF